MLNVQAYGLDTVNIEILCLNNVNSDAEYDAEGKSIC